MHLRAVFLSIAVLLLAMPGAAQTPLIADLSEHQIQITTGFVGTDVLLFGTVEADSNVVVVVRGPEEETTVWRKGRYAGVWVNDRRVVFQRVPSFYAVRSSAPLDEIASEVTRMRHGMGARFLRLRSLDDNISESDLEVFRSALIRNKQRDGLFATGGAEISFLGGQLFRTRLHFPANVPTGFYDVEVFMLQDGRVTHAQTTPLIVRKAGLGADVFFFAYNYSALYGIIAVLLAIAAGALAAFVFRKG
jgi:uncharacterized protein (TIGR02186 family)